MRTFTAITLLFFTANVFAQTPLPHGMVYGTKPDTTVMLPANKVETFMGKRTRISTTIKGKVLKVTQTAGGRFSIDAGNGKVIKAHFTKYKINLPVAIQGRIVVVEGVAKKQFIASDRQHFAGDKPIKNKKARVKANPKQELSFEVKGLMVYQ